MRNPREWLFVDGELRPHFVRLARALRREATTAEQLLWERLRGSRLGVRIRRQQPIGTFIVDFFVPAARLAIEVDGAVHDGDVQRRRDAARQALLEATGLRLLRFRNEEVETDIDAVVEVIRRHLSHPGE